MTAGILDEKNLESHIKKQMGCMTGFLHLFDRQQVLTGKRPYPAKRLPPPINNDSASESEKSSPSTPARSRELGLPRETYSVQTPPPKSPLPLPIFELKEGNKSSWKFCKDSPRLSLDSLANTDAKGGLHPKEIRTTASILSAGNRCDSIASDASGSSQQLRSPSVIARLMGLEPDSSTEKQPELRRSASESRVSRDLFHARLITDGINFYSKQPQPTHFSNPLKDDAPSYPHYSSDLRNHSMKNGGMVEQPLRGLNRGGFGFNSSSPWKSPQNRKSFFDSGDVFPEQKQTVSIYGEIEKRLKIRGIDEPSRDLDTLKQILDALQLKGLLHSNRPSEQSHRNFVYDDSPIVVMKPSRMSPVNRRTGNDYSPSNGRNQARGIRRNHNLAGEISLPVSPRRERDVRSPSRAGRSPSPTTRSEGVVTARRSNSLVKPKPLTVETQKRANQSTENRRLSPVHSPKLTPRKTGSDQPNRSPRNRKPTGEIRHYAKITTVVVAEDASSSISESSTDTVRSKTEDYNKEGKNLLERCDKLLHSIAEMNASDMQPSPVSVLDSSFYKDESLTPSPVTTKRNIDFKDPSGETEDEIWSPVISPIRSKGEEIWDDRDFVYVSDILTASHYLPEDSDIFLLLEKQQYLQGKGTSKVSRLQRKLIFDTINEILDRNRRLLPWTNNGLTKPSLEKIWSEFKRIREREMADDLFEVICGVLKKDLAGDISGWGDFPVEMSEAILDIERLIFKDLIGETIQDLAALASRTKLLSWRKLVF